MNSKDCGSNDRQQFMCERLKVVMACGLGLSVMMVMAAAIVLKMFEFDSEPIWLYFALGLGGLSALAHAVVLTNRRLLTHLAIHW